MDVNDPNFIPITPNMLNYGRSLCYFNHDAESIDMHDPEFVINHKSINWKIKKVKNLLSSSQKYLD